MPSLLADVVLSNDSLVVIAAVVGTLWTALVMLARADRAARAAESRDLRRQRDALLRVLYRLNLADEIPEEVPHAALPPPPPPPPR